MNKRYKKKITIDTSFYSKNLIKKWCEIFQKNNIPIFYNNEYLIIEDVENSNLIYLEFMNYLIYLFIAN